MGVLACDRRGCSNVMCNRYSIDFSYICGDCFDELSKYRYSINIKDFMDSRKPELSLSCITFNAIFPKLQE